MREALLAAIQRPVKGPFRVKSLPDQDLYLRAMSSIEYLEMVKRGRSGPAVSIPFVLCDKDGKRCLTAEDIEPLNDGNIKVLDDLITLIVDNHMLPSVEDARGN